MIDCQCVFAQSLNLFVGLLSWLTYVLLVFSSLDLFFNSFLAASVLTTSSILLKNLLLFISFLLPPLPLSSVA